MKNIYLLISMILIGTFAFAQEQRIKEVEPAEQGKEAALKDIKRLPSERKDPERGRAIFTEDFSDSIPSNWTNTAEDNNGDTWAGWEYRGPNTQPDTGVGSRGSCGGAPIESPSWANGFLIFDSNYWDDPNDVCGGNQGSGAHPGPQTAELITDTLDFSNEPCIGMEFYTSHREFQATMSVQAKSVGDSAWTTVWTDNVGGNEDFEGWVSLNISDAVGGKDSSLIKFKWDGNYYYWMLDDIEVYVPAGNDLQLSTSHHRPDNQIYAEDIMYQQFPARQAQNVGLNFGATVENIGCQTQGDASVSVDVTDAMGNNVFSESSGSVSLDPGATKDSLGTVNAPMSNTWTPACPDTAATYNIQWEAQLGGTDDNPNNNTSMDSLHVVDSAYARDRGFVGLTGIQCAPSDSPSGFAEFEVGNLFEFFAADTITSVSIGVFDSDANPTDVGALVEAVIYEPDGSGGFAPIGESDPNFPYTIEQDDLNEWITIPMKEPVARSAGSVALPVARYGGGAESVCFGTAGSSPAQTTFLYGPFGSGGSVDWFFSTSTAMVRPNTVGSPCTKVGVEELDQKGFTLGQNKPNPAKGKVVIDYSLESAKAVRFEVRDLAGKKIMDLNRGTEAAGQHQVELDTDRLDAGVYYYTMHADGKKATKKMVVLE